MRCWKSCKRNVDVDRFSLEGRVAVVTGGGSGLGRAISCGLAEAGACVAVVDLERDSALETVGMIEAMGRQALASKLDVTSYSDVQTLVTQIVDGSSSIDILVNCAGRAIRGTVLEYSEADWDTIINVNLKGTFLCCQAVARHMVSRRAGSIVNIASIGGFIAYPGSIAYLASKGGVIQLTRGFAVELAPYNVRVNAVAPSLFDTPTVARIRSDEASRNYFMDRTPLRRMGKPEEIVGAVVFLASDSASMVTGHILAVDGGFLAA